MLSTVRTDDYTGKRKSTCYEGDGALSFTKLWAGLIVHCLTGFKEMELAFCAKPLSNGLALTKPTERDSDAEHMSPIY